MTDRCPGCHEIRELEDLPACEGVMCHECLTDHLTECWHCYDEQQHQEAQHYYERRPDA